MLKPGCNHQYTSGSISLNQLRFQCHFRRWHYNSQPGEHGWVMGNCPNILTRNLERTQLRNTHSWLGHYLSIQKQIWIREDTQTANIGLGSECNTSQTWCTATCQNWTRPHQKSLCLVRIKLNLIKPFRVNSQVRANYSTGDLKSLYWLPPLGKFEILYQLQLVCSNPSPSHFQAPV